MLKRDLVDAYCNGRMDRRQFLKRMVGLGVSVVAAGAYAEAIAKNASAAEFDPVYGTRPVIVPLRPEPRSVIADRSPVIRARVSDRETDIGKKNITLELDGEFTRGFEYDRARNLLTYRPGRLALGKHRVIINAHDGLGGERKRGWNFSIVEGPDEGT